MLVLGWLVVFYAQLAVGFACGLNVVGDTSCCFALYVSVKVVVGGSVGLVLGWCSFG